MNTKRKLSFGAFLSTFLIVLIFSVSINAVYAYFTATAERDITFNFATLTLNMTDSSGNLFTTQESSTRMKSLPGDEINFKDVTIENAGSTSCYVLVKVDIEITKSGETTLSYKNLWYNLEGTAVNTTIASNTTEASLLEKNGVSGNSSTFDLEWTIPGVDVTNDYQGGTISATVTAYAVQAYLPDRPSSYSSDALYASYFIFTNHLGFKQS